METQRLNNNIQKTLKTLNALSEIFQEQSQALTSNLPNNPVSLKNNQGQLLPGKVSNEPFAKNEPLQNGAELQFRQHLAEVYKINSGNFVYHIA